VEANRQQLAAQQAQLVVRLEAAAAVTAGESGGVGGPGTGAEGGMPSAPARGMLGAALAECCALAAAEQRDLNTRLTDLQLQVMIRGVFYSCYRKRTFLCDSTVETLICHARLATAEQADLNTACSSR